MSTDFDYCIIGGGITGLACAWYLSQRGQVLLLEKNAQFGAETSSRNSEVIHAGLYYPPGSLKERLCLRGKELLYAFCQEYSVAHQQIGKLIVAPSADHPKLSALQTTGERLGIPLQLLSRTELHDMEPAVQAEAALFSPTTGIIDSHDLMQTLAAQAQRRGALLQRNTRFLSAHADGSQWQITTSTSDGPFAVSATTLINCGGLHAQTVAGNLQPGPAGVPQLYPCRGHYFRYSSKSPFSHLIYPLPDANLVGLGIHATLDLGGQVKFGPDTEYLPAGVIDDFQVDEQLKEKFSKAIQSYFPALNPELLQPDYAGIRPKLHSAEQPAADFHITLSHRAPVAIQLLGIESPGLTSSLAIGELVTEMIQSSCVQ